MIFSYQYKLFQLRILVEFSIWTPSKKKCVFYFSSVKLVNARQSESMARKFRQVFPVFSATLDFKKASKKVRNKSSSDHFGTDAFDCIFTLNLDIYVQIGALWSMKSVLDIDGSSTISNDMRLRRVHLESIRFLFVVVFISASFRAPPFQSKRLECTRLFVELLFAVPNNHKYNSKFSKIPQSGNSMIICMTSNHLS